MATWKTDDITLAAWLRMSLPLQDTEWDYDKCSWIFEDSDELADRVAEYIGGQAEANLKEYNQIIANMKREMYDEQRARRDARASFGS